MQFIYSKPKALESGFCNDVIRTFEQSNLKQPGAFRHNEDVVQKPDIKRSTDISFDPSFLKDPIWGHHLEHLVKTVELGIYDYVSKFDFAISHLSPFRLDTAFNLQRYEPGEAFYGWHCERAGLKASSRLFVWMVYLNTVNDGGGTQFYFQNHIEKPEQGKLLIWPVDWMYLHRGLPSLTETKYIFTGWYSFYK